VTAPPWHINQAVIWKYSTCTTCHAVFTGVHDSCVMCIFCWSNNNHILVLQLINNVMTDQSSQSQWITECNTTSALYAWLSVSKTHTHVFFDLFFFRCVLWLNDTSYSESSWRDKEEARNTLMQLLALCTNLGATMHSVTDRQIDKWRDDANSQSYSVAVQSVKKPFKTLKFGIMRF